MSATKTKTTLQASTTNAAGNSTPSAWLALTGAYKASVLARILNGAVGPTIGCTVRVDLSPDNGATVYLGAGGNYLAGTANAAEFAVLFDLPEDAMYVRVVFFGNTGQAVTVQADVTAVTGL